jgi:hypothetical protein
MKTLVLISILCLISSCSDSPESPSTASPSQLLENRAIQVAQGVSYTLDDGETLNQEFPDTFYIPPVESRNNLKEKQLVKLLFRIKVDGKTQVERMWVIVKKKTGKEYAGVLDNDATCTDLIKAGLTIRFQSRHVIQIYEDDSAPNLPAK